MRSATRSASCDPAVGLDRVQTPAKPHKMLKRSLSAPKLNDCSDSLVGSQLHQPLSTKITVATIQAKSAVPRTVRKTNLVFPNGMISREAHPTRKTQRSKSWGHSASVELANSYRNMKEKITS